MWLLDFRPIDFQIMQLKLSLWKLIFKMKNIISITVARIGSTLCQEPKNNF
jgi:hypothetical protein